jgi:hypothetical protein
MSYIAVEWCADTVGARTRRPKTAASAVHVNLLVFLHAELVL